MHESMGFRYRGSLILRGKFTVEGVVGMLVAKDIDWQAVWYGERERFGKRDGFWHSKRKQFCMIKESDSAH